MNIFFAKWFTFSSDNQFLTVSQVLKIYLHEFHNYSDHYHVYKFDQYSGIAFNYEEGITDRTGYYIENIWQTTSEGNYEVKHKQQAMTVNTKSNKGDR